MGRFFGFIWGLLSPLTFVSPAFAQTIKTCPESGPFAELCKLNAERAPTIISNLITLLLIVAVVIALFFLIYGGIRWIISGGDKTAVENARNTIIAAIVGLVIALLAFFILNFVGSLFNIKLTDLTLPKLTQ